MLYRDHRAPNIQCCTAIIVALGRAMRVCIVLLSLNKVVNDLNKESVEGKE